MVLKCWFYYVFLKVRPGFIGIYYLKCRLAGVNEAPHNPRPLDTTPWEPLQINLFGEQHNHRILSPTTNNYDYMNYAPNTQSNNYPSTTLVLGVQEVSEDMWLLSFDPNSDYCVQASWQGPFFPGIICTCILQYSLIFCWFFENRKDAETHQKKNPLIFSP